MKCMREKINRDYPVECVTVAGKLLNIASQSGGVA